MPLGKRKSSHVGFWIADFGWSILDLFRLLAKAIVGARYVPKTHNPKAKSQNLKLLNINHLVSKPMVQLAVDYQYSIRLEDLFKVWQTSKQRKQTKSEARQITHLFAVAALATANAEAACGYREAWAYGG